MLKKTKIRNYLIQIDKTNYKPFDLILLDFVNKEIKNNLKKLGLSKIEVHVDWFDNIKMIGIQAKYGKYFINIQIDGNELTFAYDLDVPDEYEILDIKNSGFSDLYLLIRNKLEDLK